MRHYLTTVLCAALTLNLQAQNDHSKIISGTVLSQEGQPLRGATIAVKSTKLTTWTDASGRYSIKLPKDSLQLEFRLIGYETLHVNLQEHKESELSIRLKPSAYLMQQVEVIGRKESGYKNDVSFSGTKTAAAIKLTPQTISYVTKETLEDQQAFKTSDAIKNVSGVNQFSYNNNDFVLRGFRASNTLINGLRISTRGWSQNLLPYVERIEVIKGPASALFANTDPGGTINTVTKKPLDENRRAINFTTGSFNTYRSSLDFTGPMNDGKTLLYRLNLAYQNAESFRVLQDGTAIVLAPSFSFIPNERTRVNFDLVYQGNKGRLDRGQPIFNAADAADIYSTPISFALGRKNDYQKEMNLFSTISLQHRLTDHMTFNASYLKSLYDEDLLEHRTSNRYATDSLGVQIPTLMEMSTIRRLRKNYVDNLSTYLNITMQTGAVSHQVLAGYDHINERFPRGNSTYNASGFLGSDGKTVYSRYDKSKPELYQFKDGLPVPNVPYFDLANPDYSISEISRYINVSAEETPSRYYVNGVYLQDQMQWKDFQLLLGFRQEFYTDLLNYSKENEQAIRQKAFIPRIGLVYTPIQPVSLYATYVEGYQPQSAGTIGSPETYGGPFDPLISNMIEAGAKMEFFAKRLFVTASVYRIEQNNILVNAGAEGNADLLRQIGQQQAKGLEIEAYGQIRPNFSITGNFSYNIAKITASDKPEEVGTIMPNAPRSQGNIWMRYNFADPIFKGFGIALGGNFASARNTNNVLLQLPSYWVANAGAYYTVDKFKIQANLNNVMNKTYWVGGFDFNRLFPGAPRNFLVSIGYSF